MLKEVLPLAEPVTVLDATCGQTVVRLRLGEGGSAAGGRTESSSAWTSAGKAAVAAMVVAGRLRDSRADVDCGGDSRCGAESAEVARNG